MSTFISGTPLWSDTQEIEALRQQLAAKQAEVDALMLEYCPSEMSQEQLGNWAAHQRPAECDEQTEVFRVEVESLRQHLIGSNTLIQTYREETTSLRQQLAEACGLLGGSSEWIRFGSTQERYLYAKIQKFILDNP